MIICGIDPGKAGGIAFLEIIGKDDGLWSIVDLRPHRMPVLTYAVKGKKRVDVDGMVLSALIEDEKPDFCLIELASAMPKQGVVSMFNYGESYGIVKGVIQASHIPYDLVLPVVWKKELGLTRNKDDSRYLGDKLFPERRKSWVLKKDDGVVEASLIAFYHAKMFYRKT